MNKKNLIFAVILLFGFLAVPKVFADGPNLWNAIGGFLTPVINAGLKIGGAKFTVDTNGNITKVNNVTTSFPASQGVSGSIIQNDGSGNLSWTPTSTLLSGTASVLRNINTTAPLLGGGNLSADRTISLPKASSTADGYLAQSDFSIFNGKQAAGNYLTALTGDGSASGPGSAALTLATVNSNVGTFNNLTVNGKGLVTGGSNVSYLTGNQNITVSGDVTGSGTTSIPLTLATVNSNVGTFGTASSVPQLTVNGKGLITAVSSQNIALPASAITSGILAVTNGGTGTNTLASLSVGANLGITGGQNVLLGTTTQITISDTPSFTGLTLSGITGTQCLHSISGVVSGTGADCGSGGGVSTTSPFTAGYVPYATTTGALTNSPIAISSGRVGIGTSTPSATLQVYGSGTTNPFLVSSSSGTSLMVINNQGNVGIGLTSPNSKLQIQGTAGTADIFIISSSSTATLLKVDYQGNLSLPHLIGNTSAPTIATSTGAGTNATVSITGSDLEGQITVNTSNLDTPAASADIATITFNKAYGSAPYCRIMPSNDAAWNLAYGVVRYRQSDTTTAIFKLRSGGTALPATTTATYTFNYFCGQ